MSDLRAYREWPYSGGEPNFATEPRAYVVELSAEELASLKKVLRATRVADLGAKTVYDVAEVLRRLNTIPTEK